jgi:hypothetical protein
MYTLYAIGVCALAFLVCVLFDMAVEDYRERKLEEQDIKDLEMINDS